MSCVPTYMTLDDHEVEDNFPSNASDKDWKTLFPVGGNAGIFNLSNASRVISDDNFTHININLKDIAVDIFERKGRRALHKEHLFDG